MNAFSKKLADALDSKDPGAVNSTTQEIMQSMADDFSALAEKYGSVCRGPLLVVAEGFVNSLKLTSEPIDLIIASQLKRKSTAVTMPRPRGEEDRP